MQGESLSRIIASYSFLQATFEQCKDLTNDTEMKSRIIGVTAQMESLDFFFGTMLAELILKHSDNLSKTLHHSYLLATLQSLRCESNFDFFWQKIDLALNEVDVNEPELPRRRRIPQRFEVGSGEPSFSETPKQFY